MRQELATDRAVGDDVEVREKVITLRLTDAEHKAWTEAAQAERRDLSNWIRFVVETHLEAATKPRKGR